VAARAAHTQAPRRDAGAARSLVPESAATAAGGADLSGLRFFDTYERSI
jgi:hypothetical protein